MAEQARAQAPGNRDYAPPSVPQWRTALQEGSERWMVINSDGEGGDASAAGRISIAPASQPATTLAGCQPTAALARLHPPCVAHVSTQVSWNGGAPPDLSTSRWRPVAGASSPAAWKVVNPDHESQTGEQKWRSVGISTPGKDDFKPDGSSPPASGMSADPAPLAKARLPLLSLGVGARGQSQDDTLPVINATIRVLQFESDILNSVSLRPTVMLPTLSNCDNGPGCQAEYRVAATLDLFQRSWLGIFAGGGVALNKDSFGLNRPMVTAGAELNFSPELSFILSSNLIFSDGLEPAEFGGLRNGDIEALFTVNYRF